MNIFQTFKYKFIWTYKRWRDKSLHDKIKKEMLDYYAQQKNIESDKIEILDYLKGHPFTTFSYKFNDEYNWKDVSVEIDKNNGLYFVVRNGNRLYFRRSMTKVGVQKLYSDLCLEQNINSPHRYLTDSFDMQDGDVFADVGSAEGILSLDLINKVNKIYLFEYDDEWIEALKYTFAPWKQKVEIVKKFVSNKDSDTTITLDTFFLFRNEFPDFIKMDVEGSEFSCLMGAKSIMEQSRNMKIAVTTYHKKDDFIVLRELLEKMQFHCEYSQGYMLFFERENFEPPYLRKALIRATKNL